MSNISTITAVFLKNNNTTKVLCWNICIKFKNSDFKQKSNQDILDKSLQKTVAVFLRL